MQTFASTIERCAHRVSLIKTYGCSRMLQIQDDIGNHLILDHRSHVLERRRSRQRRYDRIVSFLLTYIVTIIHWNTDCRLCCTGKYAVMAFRPTSPRIRQLHNRFQVKLLRWPYHSSRVVYRMTNEDNDNDELDVSPKQSNSFVSNVLNRFTSPIIDDPGLPLTDVLVAQVIAPSLQIAWISLQHAPQPTWLRPIFDTSVLYSNRGSLLAPTLIHGAALASCWITGALAAKAYERTSISPVPRKAQGNSPTPSQVEWDYSNVLTTIVKSGAFAIGLLILATQIDLLFEYKRYVQVGESDEIDFRLLVAIVEVINDSVFEAITITFWRLFLAYQTERVDMR
jgi:hypothetical protein